MGLCGHCHWQSCQPGFYKLGWGFQASTASWTHARLIDGAPAIEEE